MPWAAALAGDEAKERPVRDRPQGAAQRDSSESHGGAAASREPQAA